MTATDDRIRALEQQIDQLKGKLSDERVLDRQISDAMQQVLDQYKQDIAKNQDLIQRMGKLLGWYRWDLTRCSAVISNVRLFRGGTLDQAQLIENLLGEAGDLATWRGAVPPHLMDDDVQGAITTYDPKEHI